MFRSGFFLLLHIYSMFCIYALTDQANTVRYIGQTVQRLRKRLTQHLSHARANKHPCYRLNWLRSCLARQFIPNIVPIYHCDTKEQADEAERMYIAVARTLGMRLVNDTDGGGGLAGRRHNDITKAKMSLANKGKRRTPEERKRISEATRVAMQAPEMFAKLSAAKRGVARSDVVKEKIRLGMQRVWERRKEAASAYLIDDRTGRTSN